MKQVTLIAVLFFSLVSFSLFAADISSDFPKSDYIAQEGFGKSAKLAKTNAVNALSAYLNTEIHSKTNAESSFTETNGKLSQKKTLQTKSLITSDVVLKALQTTQPVKTGKGDWSCTAYINRKDAWNLCEPELRKKCEAFYSLYKKADSESEPIYRLKTFSMAEKAAADFSESFLYTFLFSKELTEKAFGEAFNLTGSLSSKIESARQNCTVKLSFSASESPLIKNSVISSLSECGFKSGSQVAFYTAIITIDYGLLDLSGVTVSNPLLTIELSGKSGTIYSFSASGERVSGIDSKLTKTKAEEELASLINQKLSADIKKSLGL